MGDLITQADVEKHLQINFGNDPDPVVAYLILQAEAAVAGYCRQSLAYDAAIEETFETDQPGSWHIMDRFPISGVTSVTEDGNLLVDQDDYRWYSHGALRRVSGTSDAPWSRLVDGVTVVYAAGYGGAAPIPFDQVPYDLNLAVVTVCGDLFNLGAESAAQGPVPVSSVQLEGSDQISYEVDSDAARAATPFVSAKAKQLLAPYVRRIM